MRQNELKERAEEFVLDREKIEPVPEQIRVESSPGRLTEDKPGEPQLYQTQVAVRRAFAGITVRLDAETGELLSWIIPERYKGASETVISEEQAKMLAAELVEISDEAEIEEMVQEREQDSHITNILWRHVVNGIEVEGDSISVQINSRTQEVISISKIWNDVVDHEDEISREDAERIIRQRSAEYVEVEEFEVEVIEQRFIPVVIRRSDAGPDVRMAKVWVSNIIEPDEYFPRSTELAVDCISGDIVRVEESM